MKATNIEESKTLVDFLGTGKAHNRFSSVEDIDAFVSGNREEWMNFLNSLSYNPAGGLSLEEIQAYINQERASWDNKK